MTTREKKLSVATAVVGLLAVVVGGYLFVWQPLVDAERQEFELALDIKAQNDLLFDIEKDRGRLTDALKRSLPADVDAAAREYEAVMSKLLNDADVQASTRTLKLRSVEVKAPPLNPGELDAKKQTPAYTAVGLDVTLKRVKYATLINVLERYYQLNLLHQISGFMVKRVDESGARRSGTGNADIPDLEVSFTSTAISLNGAEPRRSLLPVSPLAAAAAGGLGYAGLQQSPEVARWQTPLQFVDVLATIGRNYSKLLVQDIFHGPPPPPPPTVEVREEVKEDTSAFIRLTGLGRNTDGTGSALIEDAASRNEYAVELTRRGGKLVPLVSKFYYTAKGAKKRLDDPDSTLDISESSSGTARVFRVVGLDDAGLVLVSREAKPDTGRRPPPRTFKDAPPAAVAGVAAVAAPAETVFLWKTGEPLSKVRPLSASEARQAVQRATGGAGDVVSTSAVVDDDSAR